MGLDKVPNHHRILKVHSANMTMDPKFGSSVKRTTPESGCLCSIKIGEILSTDNNPSKPADRSAATSYGSNPFCRSLRRYQHELNSLNPVPNPSSPDMTRRDTHLLRAPRVLPHGERLVALWRLFDVIIAIKDAVADGCVVGEGLDGLSSSSIMVSLGWLPLVFFFVFFWFSYVSFETTCR